MRRVLLIATALALVTVAAGQASADPIGPGAPHLRLHAGAVEVEDGRLAGSFVVINSGTSGAPSGAAAVVLDTGHRQRLLARLRRPFIPLGAAERIRVDAAVPGGLPHGTWPLRACAERRHPRGRGGHRGKAAIWAVCRVVGKIRIDAGGTATSPGPGSPAPGGPGPGGPESTPSPPPSPPVSSVPTEPIPFNAGTPFERVDPGSTYWAFVPHSYDAGHQTPTPLMAWLHGCGGESSGDIWVVDPGAGGEPQDWITVAPGGREGGCWYPNADQAKVKAAIAAVETHFNIDRRRVILGGYSSGGDLAYRTAFYDADAFAGLLIENSSPFRDTGSKQAESLAAATWRFPVVHLAHRQDGTYPLAGVQEETNAMKAAGFPLTLIERDGGHYDEPGAIENGHEVPGTDADLRKFLLPHIDDGWLSPP